MHKTPLVEARNPLVKARNTRNVFNRVVSENPPFERDSFCRTSLGTTRIESNPPGQRPRVEICNNPETHTRRRRATLNAT